MSDVVTGDAVVLELRLARLPSRAIAFAIDLAIMVTAFLLVVLISTGALGVVDEALAGGLVIALTLAIFIGYPVAVEALTRGRSVGKLAMGLRVVREDGGPIRFRHALTRGLAGLFVDFGLFSLFTGAIGLFTSLASVKGKRVGDFLAGTVVLRERVPVQRTAVIVMPPPLARWAGQLEISRLPDDLALAARQFLLRSQDLDPQVRTSMAQRLVGEVADYVSPPPPPGTPAEPFLAAVVAERRHRESARLAAQRPIGPWSGPAAVPPPWQPGSRPGLPWTPGPGTAPPSPWAPPPTVPAPGPAAPPTSGGFVPPA